jgi:trimeric autotransporter adhesin
VGGKLTNKLTTKRALVAIVALLLALAWAVPSMGASTAKLARKALARANLAFHNADLAIDSSNKARTTANDANAAASAAKTAANTAQSTANSAQSTANTALSLASGSAHVQDNFTMSFDPSSLSATSCTGSSFSRLGVLSSDEVIVTPPDTQPIGIVTQAFTSTGQVTLEFCNVTGSPIDPPSGSYEFSSLR